MEQTRRVKGEQSREQRRDKPVQDEGKGLMREGEEEGRIPAIPLNAVDERVKERRGER